MRRIGFSLAICAGVLFAAAPRAQDRARAVPILAPRAVPPDNAILLTDMPTSRLIRVRNLTDAGWQEGLTASGASLNWPWHLSVDASGRIYIVDRDNGRIVRMDDLAGTGFTPFSGTGGNLLSPPPRIVGTTGNAGSFISNVVLDSAGRLYIATSAHGLVRVDNMSGAGWTTMSPALRGLKGVAFDRQGRIYLSDNINHRITRINDIQGSGLVTFGSYGPGVGQFNEPENMVFDAQGRLYINDESNNRIVRIDDMTGTGWTTFGSYGLEAGQLSLPHDLQFDSLGRIYIADTGNQRIVRINSMSGAGWTQIAATENGVRPWTLQAPKGIRVLGTGPELSYSASLPGIIVGDGFQTSIFGTNVAVGAPVDAAVSFTQSGSRCLPGFPVVCGALLETTVDTEPANTFTRTIPPMGSIRLDATSTAPQTHGYATVRSREEVNAVALVRKVSGGAVSAEAAVAMSPETHHFTVYVDYTNNASTAFAVANPVLAGRPANSQGRGGLVANLRDKAGVLLETTLLQFGPDGYVRQTAAETFPRSVRPGFEGSIEFTPYFRHQMQAVSLRYEDAASGLFTAMPVIRHVEDPSKDPGLLDHIFFPRTEQTRLYFPQIADGGSYRTDFVLVNTAETATTVTVEFFGGDGAPLALPIGGVSRTTFSVRLARKAVDHFLTDATGETVKWGWARVTSAAPIGGSAILQTIVNGRMTSVAAVAPSALTPHFITYVDTLGSTESGVAIANPGTAGVTARFNLRDSSGRIVESTTREIPGLGHLAQFITQLFSVRRGFDGALEVESNGGTLAAVGLHYAHPDGTVFTTLPIVPVR